MQQLSVQKIREELNLAGCTFAGDQSRNFSNAKTLREADEHSLIWIKPGSKNVAEQVSGTLAAAIVCSATEFASLQMLEAGTGFIITETPKLVFIKILQQYFQHKQAPGIHPTAYVHPEATVSPLAYIGPLVYVGKSVVEDGAVLYGHIHVYDNVRIGKNVTIHAGTIIGADGFGYDRNENNEIEKFPHIGGVVIEDDVEIGANSCIDKGTLGNTILRKNCKIDNLVHIAHNVDVGESAFVIANAMVGGSTVIGANSWIAPSVSLMQKLSIGDNTTVGMAALVTKNIPAGETWAGVPARPLKEFVAIQQGIKKLI